MMQTSINHKSCPNFTQLFRQLKPSERREVFGKCDWIPLNIAAADTQGVCHVAEWGKFSMVFWLCDFRMTNLKRITMYSLVEQWQLGFWSVPNEMQNLASVEMKKKLRGKIEVIQGTCAVWFLDGRGRAI